MKKLFVLLALLTLSIPIVAQTPAANRFDEIKRLDFLVGNWKGDGWIQLGPTERRTFTETEVVQRKLDGAVLLIEGMGKGKIGGKGEDVTIHSALAVVNYDAQAKAYRFQAYRADGRAINAEASVADNALQWSFQDTFGNVRFTIKLNDQGQWYEIGELSRDGKPGIKFFEMTLTRQK